MSMFSAMMGSARFARVGGLIGRETESKLIDQLLAGLPDGGGALVLRGDPGIGKSALLQAARERARAMGARTLVTTGVESEAEFAFAGLHQLLLPILDLAEGLAPPQRRSLDAAFGIVGDLDPDPFRVAVAAFQLFCDSAESTPLALIVDDAHWLDRSSLGVLSFVARRLQSEPIVLVASTRRRSGTPLDEGQLPTVELDRLSPAAAAELIDRSAPDLHPILRARVLVEAAGNPLALVELARALPQSVQGQERLSPAPTTLTARLEQAFGSQLDHLPPQTRAVLLTAALDSRASLHEVIESSGVAIRALDPAVNAGLIEVFGLEIRFRHPLIRSAVRQAATPGEVLAAYAALARAVSDPERQLWHRAMAADGPNEEIAVDLEKHARRARRGGAVTVAGAALERAAALTGDPERKGQYLVAAAEVAYEVGLSDEVRRLLRQAEALHPGPFEAARLAWLRQMISGTVWVERGATKTFVTVAQRMREGGDPDIAMSSLVPIAHRCWWTRTRTRTRQYLVDATTALGLPDDDPRALAVMAMAHPEATGPFVLDRVARLRLHEVGDPVAAMYAGIAAEKVGSFAVGTRFLAQAVDGLREQVRLGLLTQALVHYSWSATHSGEWEAAAAAAAEGAALARDTRQPQYGLTGELIAALLAALRGTEQDLEAIVAGPERKLLASNGGPLLATAHFVRGTAALGDARYADAFEHLWPVFDENDGAFHRFMRWPALLDLVECAAGTGQIRRLTGVIAELDAIAGESKAPILQVALTCARPFLAAKDQVGGLFEVALAQDLTGHPFLRARTLYSFGRWLRRQRRNVDARTPLRRSVDLFDALGATLWSQRARQELRATGATIGHRTPDARERLTAQELQIARLAVEGLSNRDIGQRLFLSPRTVSGHLYRIFPKLEITGRAQLRDALATRTTG